MSNLAIIPARQGSSRLPGKVMLPIGGKPLVVRTIEAAKESGLFEKIIVSSDWSTVEKVAQDQGVGYVPRSISMTAGSLDLDAIALHVLSLVEKRGYAPQVVVVLSPAVPLLSAQDICGCFRLLEDSFRIHSASTAVRLPLVYFSYRRTGKRIYVHTERDKVGGEALCSNFAVQAVRTSNFKELGKLTTGRHQAYLMPKERGIEVGDAWDYLAAKAYYEEMVQSYGERARVETVASGESA